MATFMAGIILVIAGYIRAGVLIQFVPEAVINGFTIGIAVIIATSRLKDFFGLNMASVPADFMEKLPALWSASDTLSLQALGSCVESLLCLVRGAVSQGTV